MQPALTTSPSGGGGGGEEFHISHDTSLRTILSTMKYHVIFSFQNGRKQGHTVAGGTIPNSKPSLLLLRRFKVDGTSFPDAGSLVTTAHVTREICPRDLKYRKSKTNTAAQKLLHTMWLFSCLSEIGSKRKLSFERQLLSNSVCVRKTLFVMLEIQG